MNMDQILGLLGIILGAAGGAFGVWWGRKQAARKRGLDERYQVISTKSQAMAWKITLGSIYVLFLLLAFGVQLSSAAVLGVLLIIHMAGWTFSTIYNNLKL